ncbi:MAG: hypothetical protein RLZZ511_3894 [Cyanobacteriota bacterium]|jgi:hypothetical protein
MKRRYLIGITIATVLPILGVSAATASLLPGGIGDDWQKWIGQTISNPMEQVDQQIQKGNEILNQVLKGDLGGVLGGANSSSSSPTSDSQLPDPYEVRTTQTAVSPGVLTVNPIVNKRDTANLYDQEMTRATAAPVLGKTGQKWIEQEVKKTGSIVQSNQQSTQTAQKLAQDAQGQTATQDVMKSQAKQIASLAGILGNQSKLTAENQTALLRLQQMQGTIAQLSANVSEGIDETNRRERVVRQIELSSATQAEVYIPGLFRTNQQGGQK